MKPLAALLLALASAAAAEKPNLIVILADDMGFSDLGCYGSEIMEHENNAFVRDGDWKLVGRNVAPADGLKPDRWQLYNLADDRTELKNLAKEMPDKVKELSDRWSEWARAAAVYPKR